MISASFGTTETRLRPHQEIEADLRAIEGDIVRMLAEVTGGTAASK